jgi:outer membrane usher protein FimD/PapC
MATNQRKAAKQTLTSIENSFTTIGVKLDLLKTVYNEEHYKTINDALNVLSAAVENLYVIATQINNTI